MKSDMQLQREVIEELRWDPHMMETEIGVAAKDAVVTLTGAVSSSAERYAATRAAERVDGVRAVANEIVLKLPGQHLMNDTVLAHHVVNALRWDANVPDDHITATVVDGWVTLEGVAACASQKDAAARVVRGIAGVRGVTDDVHVIPEMAFAIRDASGRDVVSAPT